MGMALRVRRPGPASHQVVANRLQGVQEVWLVDMRSQSVEISQRPQHFTTMRGTISWSVPSAQLSVLMDLSEIFAGLS